MDSEERRGRGIAMETLNKNMKVKKWSAYEEADTVNELKYLADNNPRAWAW